MGADLQRACDRGAGNQTTTAHGASQAPARIVSNVSAANTGVPSGKLLQSDPEGAALYGVSLRTFMAMQHEPWFPSPVILGPRLKKHPRSALEAAIANMPRQQRPAAEPLQLAKGRAARAGRTEVSA